ncbi:MAG: NifB/NifX family molybdenum-iron cluster-binding protein [Syntrophobacteraceae bacterium]
MNSTVKKILIVLFGNDIAPRFDLATEVMIVLLGAEGKVEEEKTFVLPQPSAEKLCHMILTENVHTVICGGIEEEYYQYLTWKRVQVIDSVIGDAEMALGCFQKEALNSGDILMKRPC